MGMESTKPWHGSGAAGPTFYRCQQLSHPDYSGGKRQRQFLFLPLLHQSLPTIKS